MHISVTVKEIQLTLKIDTHDINTKAGHAIRFLKGGDKVKVVSGIFVGYEGILQEISEDEKSLVVLANTGKRDIPIMVETKDVRIAE